MAETLLWGNRQLEGGDCCKGYVCRGDLGSPAQGRWTFFLILKTPGDIPVESVDLTVALRSWTVAHSQHSVINRNCHVGETRPVRAPRESDPRDTITRRQPSQQHTVTWPPLAPQSPDTP